MVDRIAIPVEEKAGLDAQLSAKFGTAQSFLIVDADTGEIISEIDPDPDNAAVTREALRMSGQQVKKVIARRLNPMVNSMLDDLNIERWYVSEDVSANEALKKLLSGALVKDDQVMV